MAMSKKDFIALADVIKEHNERDPFRNFAFSGDQIQVLADFCQSQNPNFDRDRWLGYIAGENGPNGGKIS